MPRSDDFGKWNYEHFEPQYPNRYAATTTIRPRKGDDDIAIPHEFDGGQQSEAYRSDGEPVTRILPRALLVPPGIPEFLTRERIVDAGRVSIEGRAWSGFGEITRVELSTDGGDTWNDAELDAHADRYAWRGWRAEWNATPGRYELCCRATDASGNTQPLLATWNHGGYCNNAVQRVAVNVR